MPLIRPDSNIPLPALLKRFALIYLPIVIVLSIALLSSIRLDEQRLVERREGRENSRIEIAKGLVTQEFSVVTSDLRVITNLPLLNGYLDSGNPVQREELEKFFLVLARESRLYDQVRYLDASGQGTLQTNKGLFVYTTVYPLLPEQRSSMGSALANVPSQYEVAAHEYYWKIVSFVPHAALSGAAFYNQTSSRVLLVIVYLLLALAVWVIANVTLSRSQARAALRDKEYLLAESQRIALLGSWHYVLATGQLTWTQEAYHIYGVSPDTFTPNVESLLNLIHPDDRPAMQAWIANCAADKKPDALEFRIILPDGTVRILNGHGELKYDAWNNPHHMIGFVHDITERKKLEDELKRQARIDLLTGLNNRRHFFELAERELARAKRYGTPLPALMLDVDHFKLVNDTYGHHVGDLVLQKLSEVCVQTLRGIDILGRLGGEEFAILLPESKSEQALEVAERLRLAVAGATVPLEHGGSIHLTVSIGIALYVSTDAKVDDILKRADTALYAAKNAGRNRVCSEGIG